MNGRLLAVCLDYAARAAASLLFALPVVALVAGTGVGRFPEGDRLLFEPGALVASEVVHKLVPALGTALSTSFVAFVVLAALLVVPHAAVLSALAETGRLEAKTLWGRALSSVPALLLLTGVALLAQVLLLALSSGIASFARGALASSPRLADGVFLAVIGGGALLALGVGVARDVARASAVQRGSDGRSALVAIPALLRGRAPLLLQVFATRAAAGCVLLVATAFACGLVDVGRPGNHRLALVAFLHQAAALGVAALRVSWFRATLDPALPSR
ncbi:MAG TPA: hypothetical protein VGK73_02075 [Polyangiaceae bacterium]